MPDISEVIAKLDRDDPFSPELKKGLGKRNMTFVRQLQISRKISKQEALDLYGSTNLKSKAAKKKLQNEMRKTLKERYPRHEQFKTTTSKEFEKPIQKTKAKREEKKRVTIKQWKKSERIKWRNYLESKKYRLTPKYITLKKNHKIYPDASLYELRHGLNSKASKAYRVNHGLSKEYTGRVKK